ncbi:hypothetical protein LRD18_03500 [Halorhodospira halochloris]|uniref:hypothetical protein n=1 Tax=Halorhodospira halochloris TaxID=1052 RepID=UPI001EE883A8|nr:hypothetical protein [Halorhodospira halochloris]MCG5529937.1 hypothetical protein [Halorhodospira halochloris]
MDRAEFEPLIPHSGSMCLLDKVLEWDDQKLRATTTSHRREDNPLRGELGLGVVHALEYGAQGMAVHGALLARSEGGSLSTGFLAASRDLRFYVGRLDSLGAELLVEVEQELGQAGSMIYRFQVASEDRLVAEGQAIVVAIRDI